MPVVAKAPGFLSARGREEQDRQGSFYAAYILVGKTKYNKLSAER